jgi:hypothetical protein
MDRAGHVASVNLRGTTTAGSHVVHVSVSTSYGHYNNVQPIHRP